MEENFGLLRIVGNFDIAPQLFRSDNFGVFFLPPASYFLSTKS